MVITIADGYPGYSLTIIEFACASDMQADSTLLTALLAEGSYRL